MLEYIAVKLIQNIKQSVILDPNRNNQMVNGEGNVKTDNACVHKHYVMKAQGTSK
jgi:hypothetical protein